VKPKIIFLIRSNPVKDSRVAEAIRMAAGFGTGENSVKIVLTGEARHLLDPDIEEMADMEVIERFLPILGEWNIPFYVEKESMESFTFPKGGYDIQPVGPEELAEVMAGGHCFFVF
jgi:hypothetical protein